MTLCSFTVGYVNIPTHTNLLTGHPPKAGADGEEWLCGQTLSCTAYFFPASADLLRLPVRRTPLVPPQRSGAAPA